MKSTGLTAVFSIVLKVSSEGWALRNLLVSQLQASLRSRQTGSDTEVVCASVGVCSGVPDCGVWLHHLWLCAAEPAKELYPCVSGCTAQASLLSCTLQRDLSPAVSS